MATERVQVNLRMTPEMLARIDARARRHGLSRNAWLEMAAERILGLPTQTIRGSDQRF